MANARNHFDNYKYECMKKIFLIVCLCYFSTAYSQSDSTGAIETRHPVNQWWWVISVVIALALGILAYMLIKKNPRKDAV